MSKKITSGVHHIAIICSDYERSKQFYRDVLQTEIVSEEYRAQRQSWKLLVRFDDGVQIELFSFPDSPPRLSYPEARGLRHLALNTVDIEASLQHLQAHNVTYEDVRVDEITNAKFVFFADPDGLPIELYEV